jgi:GT2 family glycosyltransferase
VRDESRMVCFVCVFVPRRTLEAVGLLDEQFVGYGCDDDDYCLRVRKAGLKIGIFDGCFVDHSTLKSTYRGRFLGGNYQPNLKLFAAKWGALEGAQVGKF